MYGIGKLVKYDGEFLYYKVPAPPQWKVEKQKFNKAEIRFDDSRMITSKQRKAIYATLLDIAMETGYDPEEAKAVWKYMFLVKTGGEYFSLSDCSVTLANQFLEYLILFCVEHEIPTSDSLSSRSPDIGKYVYACIVNRVCAICQKPGADIHHIDRVGIGGNRNTIVHEGMEVISLCREHHNQCHMNSENELLDKHHLFGIKLDKYLCEKLGLNTEVK